MFSNETGQGFDVIADARISLGQQVARTEARRLIAMCQCHVATPKVAECQREQPVGSGKIRIEAESLLILDDSLTCPTAPRQYVSECNVSPRFVAIQSQCNERSIGCNS